MQERQRHHRFALVVTPPRPVEVLIEDAYLRWLGTSKPNMGFHITIVGPFLWKGELDENVLRQVGLICAAWQPFRVCIHGLDAFRDPDRNAVYIPVHNAGSLMSLHDSLQTVLSPVIVLQRELPEGRYLPHITLGLGLTDRELERVLKDAHEYDLQESFEVEEIHLTEERPSAPWRRIRSFPLSRSLEAASANVNSYD